MARNWSACRLAPPIRTPSIRLTEKYRGVIRFDAATVLDRKRLSRLLIEDLTKTVSNEGVRLPSLLRSGVSSVFANCPDRFVGDAQSRQGLRRETSQAFDELAVEHGFGLVGVTLCQCLSHAQDHVEAGCQSYSYLLVDEGIQFTEDVAALAVSEDHVAATEIEKHRRANFARERAFLLGKEILRPQGNRAML